MRLHFHGAAREVTGSCHLVEVAGRRILLDCGMIQGGRDSHARNREPFGFDAAAIDRVVLSHAHIDHSGRLPLLLKSGYRGEIVCTEATADLARILLLDSGRIHEEDARWKIKRLRKQGKDFSWVTPLFTEDDAKATIERLRPVGFRETFSLDGAGEGRFVKAGHILGAGIVELELREGETRRRLVFSGDLGVEGARLLSAPKSVRRPDYLLMESTYGDRNRRSDTDRTEQLFEVVDRTFARGGKVIIPSFAVGRTQELLARLNDLVESGRLAGVPVYVDSPMAVEATGVFARHPDAYSKRAYDLLRGGDEPLEFPGLTLTQSVDESKALNFSNEPSVIISASGMCTAGRIKHHLKHNISDPKSTILFVGYQARETLGQIIQRGTDPVRIFGDWFEVKASIETIDGFSAHADQAELLTWFGSLGGCPRRSFLVHGDERAALTLADLLRARHAAQVDVPEPGQSVDL